MYYTWLPEVPSLGENKYNCKSEKEREKEMEAEREIEGDRSIEKGSER
jgi:hypothetical protein